MPITRPEAEALAELLAIVRPNWTIRGIMAGLRPLAAHPAPLETITWAAIRAARNPAVDYPSVIPLNGPHWDLAERIPEPRLTPDLECPRHVGKWAGNCPECRAEQLGHPDAVPEPEDDGLSHLAPRARIREATARAKRIAHQLDAEADAEDPTLTDAQRAARALAHQVQTPDPTREGMTRSERRHAAMRDNRPVPAVPSPDPVIDPAEGDTP